MVNWGSVVGRERRWLEMHYCVPTLVCYWNCSQTYSSPSPVSVRQTSSGRSAFHLYIFSSAHSLSLCVCVSVFCYCLFSQELFSGLDGVKLLTGYLQSANRSLLDSGLGYHRLMLSVTDCVWCTVVGNPLVEDIFLEEGGVFCLLDLLQV